MTAPKPGIRAASGDLIEELMGSVVALEFLLQTLMEIPAETLPGENRSEVIRELLIASACREIEAVGEDGCRAATALIGVVVNRIADDVELVRRGGRPPC